MTIPKQAQVRETGWSTCWKAQSPQRIIRRVARVSKNAKRFSQPATNRVMAFSAPRQN